jgi:hypothetical protein
MFVAGGRAGCGYYGCWGGVGEGAWCEGMRAVNVWLGERTWCCDERVHRAQGAAVGGRPASKQQSSWGLVKCDSGRLQEWRCLKRSGCRGMFGGAAMEETARARCDGFSFGFGGANRSLRVGRCSGSHFSRLKWLRTSARKV